MDDDSSTKFIESLTKFLQSLCNGYVEFQRGVELVGHIYLSVDTGEKVDYILHEKVSKNDENSVTFVSNSFHALPKEKDKSKAPANAGISKTLGPKGSSDDDDDDDIVIVDQPDNVLGSTNSGTLPYRGLKRVSSASSDHRRPGVSLHRSPSGGSSYQSSPWRKRQPSGPAATAPSQENISIGEVKLEQISSDELLTLASQVDDGASSSQGQGRPGGGGQSDHGSFSSNDAPGQAWIKQEPMDETQRGLDTGWSQSDSSNSGSNLYPVMMHQNSAAFTSSPVIPGFSSSSGLSGTLSSRHGLGQSLPGTPGGSNPYGSPMPGTSQNTSGMDPSDWLGGARLVPAYGQQCSRALSRPLGLGVGLQSGKDSGTPSRYRHESWLKLKQNPERYERWKQTMREVNRKSRLRKKMRQLESTQR